MNAYIEFATRMGTTVLQNLTLRYGSDNWDNDRYGKWHANLEHRLSRTAIHVTNRLLQSRGGALVAIPGLVDKYESFMRHHGEGIAELYDLLGDEYSKAVLVDVMAYRLLGYERMRLSTHRQYRDDRARAATLAMRGAAIDLHFLGWKLQRFDPSSLGYPISLHSTPAGIASEFIRSSYVYDRTEPAVGPAPGNYVIDGGRPGAIRRCSSPGRRARRGGCFPSRLSPATWTL